MLRTAAERVSTALRPTALDGSDVLVERARHLAAGLLGAGVVHEYANLLTVLDGMSQMSRIGISWSDAQQMLSTQEVRGRDLVSAYRHFFADRATDAPVGFDAEMRQLETLLRIRLRGHHTHIDFTGASAPFLIDGRRAPAVRMSMLIATLAHVDGTRAGEELRTIRCVPGGSGDTAEWILRSDPAERPLVSSAAPELFALAGVLANQWGGTLRSTTSGLGARETRLELAGVLVR